MAAPICQRRRRLVAIRPDPALAEVLGVRYLGASQIDDTCHPAPATGIAGPLQIHTVYDRVELRGQRRLRLRAMAIRL